MRVKVAIIGAGMAGSSAAEHLYANGVTDIVLIEAKDRTGGRMYSILHNGRALDLGAQWITGVSPINSVYNLATKMGIVKGDPDEIDDDSGLLSYALKSEGTLITAKTKKMGESINHTILQDIHECHLRSTPHGGSIMSFYDEKTNEYLSKIEDNPEFPHIKSEIAEFLRGQKNTIRSYVGGEPDDCSVDLFGRSIEFPCGEMPVKGGVGQIVHKLLNTLSEGSILLNSPVHKIDWSDPNDIRIATKGKEEIIADYVISTIPLGVLKTNHENLFYPGLGQKKIDVINTFSAGQTCKLFLEWENPWWTKNFGSFTLTRKEGDTIGDWTDCVGEFSRVKDHPSLLLTWVVGKYSPQVDRMKDEEVIDGMMRLLRKYTGDPSLERAKGLIRTTWNTDPYTQGSYSSPSVRSSKNDIKVLASSLPDEETPRILFAGEATSTNYWSFMHGARSSGLQSAEKIIRLIKNNNNNDI